MQISKLATADGGVSDVVGIDLGTTNSAVAIMRYGHVDVIASNEGFPL
jgi:molecular chaperone DnaK (HSP70)